MATYEVKSEITGTVCKVTVNIGDHVAEDDPLVFVESMKMEIPVVAPRGGRVTEIRVAEGDSIGEGDVTAILEV
ncbi:biotin/lipoyl-binding carrier protein [Imbroritus primus]|uniref:Biotin/lipoyl-binding carrier protein n=1 Tax=Imbroritus primus TaxID=3058603 RepID=A0ACD3SMD9_9BURK|nr:biotin/lipoyl-binding carrier protein [Burkholderiaceae bacterium PBA]